MRSDTVNSFQMFRMHKESGKLIGIIIKSEQHADPHIINAAFHGTIHGFRMVCIIMFRTCRMQYLILLFIVCLLKQDVSADSRIFELPVVLDSRGCNIDVDPADRTVLVLDRIDCLNAFKNILDRVVYRVLTGFYGKPLVSHILQGDDLSCHLFLCQFFPRDVLVLHMVWTVQTAVYAVIGQIERGKQHNTVPVKILFYLLRKIIDFLYLSFILAGKQNACIAMTQTFALFGLLYYFINKSKIVLMFFGILHSLPDLFVIDEFLGLH